MYVTCILGIYVNVYIVIHLNKVNYIRHTPDILLFHYHHHQNKEFHREKSDKNKVEKRHRYTVAPHLLFVGK